VRGNEEETAEHSNHALKVNGTPLSNGLAPELQILRFNGKDMNERTGLLLSDFEVGKADTVSLLWKEQPLHRKPSGRLGPIGKRR
jgi:hypothetical protein